jgi:type IV pilus assembly protein PilF
MKVKMLFNKIVCVLLFCFLASLQLTACSTTKSATPEEDAKSAKINMQLGMSYLQKKDMKRAKERLLAAIDTAPNMPECWYSFGYFLEMTGEPEQAEKYYLTAVKLAPGKGDTHNNYGTFLCRVGKYKQAIHEFLLAVGDMHYLQTASAYENAGLCAMKIPNRQLALLYFNKALKHDPFMEVSQQELAMLNSVTYKGIS